jgi:hypothetical protein
VIVFIYLFVGLQLSNFNDNRTFSKLEIIFGNEDANEFKEYDDNLKEPNLFKKFEVFDRAALNFFYNNPKFMFFGTGPNLISIPASDYIDSYSRLIYGNRIDSVPHTGLVNIFSRSGIVGFVIYLYFLYSILLVKKYSKRTYLILLTAIICYFFTIDYKFYVLIGIAIGINKGNYDKYNNPSI